MSQMMKWVEELMEVTADEEEMGTVMRNCVEELMAG